MHVPSMTEFFWSAFLTCGESAAALARTWRPGVVAGPIRRPGKRIGAAPAAFRPYRRPALIERRIAAVLGAVPRVDRAPASGGSRRLAPLRARPALGVSVGEQQSHYCDTEQNKTDRAHGSSPSRMLCDRSPIFGLSE